MTKKHLLAALNAAPKVKVTLLGGSSVEDWPMITAQALAVGYTLDGDTLRNGTAFVMKPKLNRVRRGVFKSSASNYTFTWDGKESHGLVKDLREVSGALELTMAGGMASLRYEVDL